MNIYHSIEEFPSDINTVVTIGTFDGVHKGHKIIINRLNAIAKKRGFESVVLTFDPHPRHVIYSDDQALRLINTVDEKVEALRNTSLDHLIIHRFTKDFSRIKSVNFIRDVLVNKLNMRHMVVGFDHHFGKNRKGTFENLFEISELYDFRIERVERQNVGDVTVSSTKIRNAIIEGDIEKANSYLCSGFSIKGRVVRGNRIGASIGFPTANIRVDNKWKILPKAGVYAVKALLERGHFYGMLNLGVRPSISDDSFVIEVHLFGFSSNIYNDELKIMFIERLRDEKKFDNLDQLKSQLKIDETNCRKILKRIA